MRYISFLCFSLSPFPPFSIANIWMSQILCFELMCIVESFTHMCVTSCSDAEFALSLLFTILLISRTWYTHCSWFFLTMMFPPCPQPLSQPRSSINCSSFLHRLLHQVICSTCQKENAESFSWKEIDAVVKATWSFRVCQSFRLWFLIFFFVHLQPRPELRLPHGPPIVDCCFLLLHYQCFCFMKLGHMYRTQSGVEAVHISVHGK